MQSRSLKPRKNYPKHTEFTLAPLDANTSYAHILDVVGERKKVFDVGCGNGYLASLFVKRECDVVGLDINPIAAEEARKYCTSVIVADLDESLLPELLEGRQFDAIVFADVLEHLHEPTRTLDESRALLSERGYVVASIPNVSHGAIRLALLSGRFDYQELGILDDSHLRFFTSKTVDELFLTAGFRVESVERVTLPLFTESDLVPELDPRDFDERAVAEIKADPDSETLQFIVKAVPLSNDQRLRTISKRFLTTNTELTATKQQVVRRDTELDALRDTVASQDGTILDLREQMSRAQSELKASNADLRTLEDRYRALEIDGLAKQNVALERNLVAQAEHARSVETIAELQLKLEEAEHAQAAARPDADGELRESLALLERETRDLQQQLRSERQRSTDVESSRQSLLARIESLTAVQRHLESGTDALRGDTAALTKNKLQLEARLHDEVERNRRLAEELAGYASRASEQARRVQDLHASTVALEERLRAETAAREQRETELQSERQRDVGSRQQAFAMQSVIEAMDAELAMAHLELLRTRATIQLERQSMLAQRVAFSERIAQTEQDCDELLGEAVTVVDAIRSQIESVRFEADLQTRESQAVASDLQSQLNVVRKASLADKLVMREYADDFRQRAERAEKELHDAIRQRDDLYLRFLEAEKSLRESGAHNAHLDREIAHLGARLNEECVRSDRAAAQLAEHLAQSRATIDELNARSQATIADLTERATSLQNDAVHQQAVLDHLRESANADHARADAAAADLASLTVRYDILQGKLAEMDNLLVAQTEQLLASTSDERERLLTLIDTVQSSRFWRLKHWLARLRSRLFGGAVSSRGA